MLKKIVLLYALACGLMAEKAIAQTPLIDSLKQVLPSLQGRDRMRVLGDLCWESAGIDADAAVKYGSELLKMAEQLKDSTEIAEACNLYCTALYRKGNYEEALLQNRRAYRIRLKKGDPKAIGSSLNKFVNIYTDQVRLDSALKYGIESLKIFESTKDSANLAITYNTLSHIQTKDRDFASARTYAQQAYDIAKSIGFDYATGGAAGNLAVCYESLGDIDGALNWYSIAKVHFEKVGSAVDLGTVANNLGVIYRKQKRFDLALENYRLAYDMAKEMNSRSNIAHAAVSLGQLLTEMNKAAEGKTYLQEGIDIAEQEKLGRLRIVAYTGMVECMVKLGDSQLASHYLNKYMSLQDSLYNSDKAALMQDMRAKYDTEKKEQENEFLRIENERKDEEKKRMMIIGMVVFVLIAVMAYLYYLNYKRKQREAMQAELLKERERGLAAVFEATETERQRIAKDLHDGIGQQLSGLKLSWDGLTSRWSSQHEAESEKLKSLTGVLDEACAEVRSISHQMMPKALMEKGLLPALEDMLRKSLGLSNISYSLEHFKVEGERYKQTVELSLFRISQELVNNIIKHSGATHVNVQLYRAKQQLILVIEDNGKGFDAAANKGGIGMMNITSRLSTVAGEVIWEPGPETGAVATIRVPIVEE